jgi:hypothetical protein
MDRNSQQVMIPHVAHKAQKSRYRCRSRLVLCLPSCPNLFLFVRSCSLSFMSYFRFQTKRMARPYVLKPLKIGCEVLGIDLSILSSKTVIEQIKKDVTLHRILVFRNQSKIFISTQQDKKLLFLALYWSKCLSFGQRS